MAMSPSSWLHYGRTSSPHTIIALVTTVAVAVAVHSTVAAPQSDGFVTITIAGQQCNCVPWHMCEWKNTVNVTSSFTESPELGCAGDLVCCQKIIDIFLPLVTESYIPSSELPQISSSTQEPYIEDNKSCTCVSRNQCSPAPYGSNQWQSSNIGAGSCSINKVCCVNEYINIGTTQETPINGETITVRSCGIENSNTNFGQFAWMAAILQTDINRETGIKTENVFLCGGSLIHPRVILTAAHCVSGKDVKLMKVRVGVWDTQGDNNEEDRENSHEDRAVSKVVNHPNYDKDTMFYDVALVELQSEIILHPHVNVICIPNNEKQSNYDPQSCVSTGWGKNGFERGSQYQTVLKKVDLPLVSNDWCQQQLRTTRLGSHFRLHESFLCAGGIKGVDVCKGDGGGPLICAMKGYQGMPKKYIQVGIVSWGMGCGDENIPGVYSSVEVNSQWINKELKRITSQ